MDRTRSRAWRCVESAFHRVCMGTLVVSMLCLNSHAAGTNREGNGYLPLRESLIPMFAYGQLFKGNYFHQKHFPMNRINPAAQKYILYHLAERMNSNEHPPHTEGIWLLGFVGDKEGASFLKRYMKWVLDSPRIGRWERAQIYGGLAGACAGMMQRRRVEGAKELVYAYADFQSWLPTDRKPDSAEVSALSRAHDVFLGAAYKNSKDAFLLRFFRTTYPDGHSPTFDAAVLARMKPLRPHYDELMEPCSVPEDKLRFYYEKCFEVWGPQIDDLIAKADGAGRGASKPLRQGSAVAPTEDGSHGVGLQPATVDIRMLGSGSLHFVSLCREGVDAYLRLVGLVLDKKYDQVLGNVMDNGRPLAQEKLERTREHALEALRVEQSILAEAKQGGMLDVTRYRGFRIEASVTARADHIWVEKPEAVSVTGSEEIDLFFVIPNTATIYKKNIPRIGGPSAQKTRTPEGDLQVYMKRINGTWYWNPFGW